MNDLTFCYERVAVRNYPGACYQWFGNIVPITLFTYFQAHWKIEQFCQYAAETYGIENAKIIWSDTEQGILLHELGTD